MNDQELLRYSRHLLLDEFDLEHQSKLLSSKVLIVGAGGLGSPVALYLAAAGVGQLIIADHDCVDLSNLQRQIIHQHSHISVNKSLSAKIRLEALNPDIRIEAIETFLNPDMLNSLIPTADLVIDCTDNFDSRYAINRSCIAHRIPLISGAAIKFAGLVSSFDFRQPNSPCYHCLFPEDTQADELRCATTGVFSPLVGIVGSIQAAEALKILTGIGEALTGRLLRINALTLKISESLYIQDPECPVCHRTLQNR